MATRIGLNIDATQYCQPASQPASQRSVMPGVGGSDPSGGMPLPGRLTTSVLYALPRTCTLVAGKAISKRCADCKPRPKVLNNYANPK
jgi:hypothetical protein